MKDLKNNEWLVLYTRSRWEKKIHQMLSEQDIRSYCPLVKKVSQWADRKKIIEIPLFNSYIFVEATPSLYNRILQTPGVINYITYCGKPATIANDEIELIKSAIKEHSNIEAIPLGNLHIGDIVKIVDGPLSNHTGEIQKIQGKQVIMIIKYMNCALTIKINHKQLSPKPESVLC
ncbi:UpxY family transcription antiterminator [Mucilaginibacter limnophilus]|uniref:UpxY family transcription antiterminator n=1 Tax=Mucilaginibacter limnophilus TaxID=1932778 RepID=A0A3S2Y5D8_9SPHI|nr:UpxY family transcription antiterminator [Mucilaginibacter limnophilus]RVU02458.1 UpxY family transcription antiterminator [Mucilaginibacter limnophilus]